MTADLLVIVPSRGRPQNIVALCDAWQETATENVALLVAVDDDDPAVEEYIDVSIACGFEIEIGARLRLAGTLNKLAIERAPHHFAVGFLGDDHRPRSAGWNQRFVDALRELGTGFVYGNDLFAGERLPTQVAMTSDIIQTLGYMVPPGPRHMWIDNMWHDLGHAIDRIRYLENVVIEHMHPIAGKAEDDSGYREVNDPDAFEADRLAYAAWLENGFAVDVEKLKALL